MLASFIANAQIIKADLTAMGLTCSMCSKATYKQLTSITGVEKVDTDLNRTAFIIHFKSGSSVDIGSLKQKVEEAGFSVGELIVYMNLNGQKAENNSTFTLDNNNFTFIDTKPAVLTGITKIKVLDKGFVTDKVYKKYEKMDKQYPSYSNANNKSYHIKPL